MRSIKNKLDLKPRVLEISAKCSDLFSAQLRSNTGELLAEYDGYVPNFFPEQHWGDYVILNIDINTGKILNWKKPNAKQLDQLKYKRGA